MLVLSDPAGRCLARAGGYTSVWTFLLAMELMLSNAQVFNEEKSPLWLDAEVLRKSARSQIDKAGTSE